MTMIAMVAAEVYRTESVRLNLVLSMTASAILVTKSVTAAPFDMCVYACVYIYIYIYIYIYVIERDIERYVCI